MARDRVRLIHWNAVDAAPLLAILRKAGYHVEYEANPEYHLSQAMKAAPPAAVVIDLSRLPSHGREIGIYLRGMKALRHVPLVYVNGVPEKVETVRQKLPDATYTTAARVLPDLRRAIRNAPASPVVPAQMMERYKAKAAAQKLGIRAGHRVAVLDPPRDYAKVLGAMPEGVSLHEDGISRCDIALWFVRDTADYEAALPGMRDLAARSKLWVLWQKQSARKQAPADITQRTIRESALAMGLVDYKICAVNETWSALAFARKK